MGDWIYLKAVDTNMHNNLSLTDDQYTSQCAPVAESANTPSCRAFDMTVQAWNLVAVFSTNQGSLAGEPAGLNGVIPVEYEELWSQPTIINLIIYIFTPSFFILWDFIVRIQSEQNILLYFDPPIFYHNCIHLDVL